MPDIPQIAFPPRLDETGRLALVEQGSVADIVGRVHALILTPPGWLESLPDCGLEEQAHLEGGADVVEIERQLVTYIPQDDFAAAVQEDVAALNERLAVLDIQIGA